MTARFDREVDAIEDDVSCGAYSHTFKCNRHPLHRRRHALPSRHGFFFKCAERLQETERRIAHGRILPGNLRDFLSEGRQIQSPINKQKHTARFTMSSQVPEHKPRREAESDKHLQAHDSCSKRLKTE